MAMYCDASPEGYPAGGIPHTPMVNASQQILDVRKQVDELLNDHGTNDPKARAAKRRQISERMWSLHVTISLLEDRTAHLEKTRRRGA